MNKEINWFDVIRDVATLWFATFIAELLVVSFQGRDSFLDPATLHAIANAKKLAIVGGFALSGALGRKGRSRRTAHLAIVLGCFWLVGLTNMVFLQNYTIRTWIAGFPLVLFFALIGGGLSLLIAPLRDEQQQKPDTDTSQQGASPLPPAPTGPSDGAR